MLLTSAQSCVSEFQQFKCSEWIMKWKENGISLNVEKLGGATQKKTVQPFYSITGYFEVCGSLWKMCAYFIHVFQALEEYCIVFRELLSQSGYHVFVWNFLWLSLRHIWWWPFRSHLVGGWCVDLFDKSTRCGWELRNALGECTSWEMWRCYVWLCRETEE